MPVKLNLLPPELAISKNLGSVLKTVRALGVIGIVTFLIFGIGVGVIFIISSITLNGVNASITKLTSEVSAQQKSEQQVILIKDRLGKIVLIQRLPNSLTNQIAAQPFLDKLSTASFVNQMSIDAKAVDITATLKTSSDLATFIDSFQSSDVFKSVKLTSFNFSPTVGYSVEINAAK
jgi:Tfp pilus assembly protein PilN